MYVYVFMYMYTHMCMHMYMHMHMHMHKCTVDCFEQIRKLTNEPEDRFLFFFSSGTGIMQDLVRALDRK